MILDGFPRTGVQAVALDRALAERAARVGAAVLVDVPADELVRRMSGRWICRAAGHPYHETFSPPRVAGVCDLDGSELYQRVDDRPDTIRARMDQQLGALAEVIDHYRAAGVLRTVDGLQEIDACGGGHRRSRSRRRASRPAGSPRGARGGLMQITIKSKEQIAKMRSAGRIVAEVLALVEESLRPGISTAELDRLADRHIRAAGGTPSFVGYLAATGTYDPRQPPRVPGRDLHLHRPRDRPRDPR